MNEIDNTVREAEANIERTSKMLVESEALLKRSEEFAAQGATPETVHAYLAKQDAETRTNADKEIQALHEELERDLPKREAQRNVRVRAHRTMV
jgi:hypothetical protein